MRSDRATAIVVGGLFITATAASIIGSLALGATLDGPNYLTELVDQRGRVIPAVLLFLVAASAAFTTAILLYPILRRRAEGLAAAYVGARAFENLLYVIGAVTLLAMTSVSESDVADTVQRTDLELLGTALAALQEWPIRVGTLVFASLGGVVLNAMLFSSGLIPRWLSSWGVAGASLLFVYGFVGILGWSTDLGSPYMLLAMPIAVQEMVFAVRLITRGFDRDVRALESTRHLVNA